MMLPVGGKFTRSNKDKVTENRFPIVYHQDEDYEVMFVSPDLNMTYYQYTGDRGDSAMIQLIKDRDTEKLSLHAFIREKMLPLTDSVIFSLNDNINELNSLAQEVSW